MLCACIAAFAAMPPTWVKPEGFAYTLSLFAQVIDADGNAIAAEGSALAAFDADGVCRGLKTVRTNADGVTLYQMSVASNKTDGETLSLRIYDAARDEVLEIEETLEFENNAVIPPSEGRLHPQVYHVRPPFTLPASWAKPTGYAYTLSLFAQVQGLDGSLVEADGSALAVFDAYGRCRGLAEVRTNSRGVRLYQMSVSSNSSVEQGLTLKVADAATREIYDVVETLDFEVDGVVPPSGGAVHPKLFHAKAPAAVRMALAVASGNGAECVLDFAADGGAEDAYGSTKDVLSLSEDAYIVGTTAGGGAVNLQKSTVQLKDITRWRIAVAVEAGGMAVVGWDAFDSEGRRAYLFAQDGSCMAEPLTDAGSIVLKNSGKTAQTRFLTLVCATDDAVCEFALVGGWNLASFPFEPSDADSSALLSMRPMALADGAYVFANSVEANTGYWIHMDGKGLCVLERQPLAAVPVFSGGWRMIGVPAEIAELPEGSSSYAWEKGRFVHVERLVPGRGYLVYVEEQ